MASLKTIASAQARRAVRVACCAITARTASGAQPERATTRVTCVASLQSTTNTLSTLARHRSPTSTRSGTSNTTHTECAAYAACACAAASASIRGCKMLSSKRFFCRLLKTTSRIRARSRAPLESTTSTPRASTIARTAAPFGAVRSRAMLSVSTKDAPCACSSLATVLLPLPMPPVRPIVRTRESRARASTTAKAFHQRTVPQRPHLLSTGQTESVLRGRAAEKRSVRYRPPRRPSRTTK